MIFVNFFFRLLYITEIEQKKTIKYIIKEKLKKKNFE